MSRVKKVFKYENFDIEGFVGDRQFELTIYDGEQVTEHVHFSYWELAEIVNCAQEIFDVPLPKMGKMWVGLTVEDVKEILNDPRYQMKPLIVHAVEDKLKEKNT